jgi:uncharacterized protein
MERKIHQKLINWKKKPGRLPLILQGARQVGKTYCLLQFGKTNYRNVAYFNFESNPELDFIFKQNLSPAKLLPQLAILAGTEIFEEETLIIFDEIQSCETALTSLKYFAEEAPTHHIVAAGSLLGVAINRNAYSFPVGKVSIENLYPMDFEEFLWAMDKKEAANIIREYFHTQKECALHNHFLEYFRLYLALGGMPRVIKEYIENADFDFVTSIQSDILTGYTADMAKYAAAMETVHITAAFNSIPAQLAKENRKFQYNIIKSGARAKNYEGPIDWLAASGIVTKVNKCPNPRLPLSAYALSDFFKLYLNDTGLLCSKFGLNNQKIAIESYEIAGIKGVLAENYVAAALKVNDFNLYYWESEGKAEVDFIIQDNAGRIIPVEVKSSNNVRSKSLAEYIKIYKPEIAYRVSTKNFGSENNLNSIPLYAVFCLSKR